MESKIEWVIPEAWHGCRIDKALAGYLQDRCSRSLIQKNIRDRHLWINGNCVMDAGHRVKTNDHCRMQLEIPEAISLTPNPLRVVPVLYEDSHLLAVNKPEGMPVHFGHGIEAGTTLVEALLPHTPLSPVAGSERPGVVHRLDQDTSGVILLAKTDAAYWALVRLFTQRKMHKTYHALVCGIPGLKSGEIHAPIGRMTHDRTKMCVTTQGREALTHWECLESYPKTHQALLACYPITGRTHQIRVHLKHIGLPIVGDPKYGKITDVRLFLHACAIEFLHPFTQKFCRFVAPWPASFAGKITQLRQQKEV